MANRKPVKGGVRAYARHRGIDASAVVQAVKAGRIKKDGRGQIDFAKADKDWAANTKPRMDSAPPTAPETTSESGTPDYFAERARKAAADARLAEMKADERAGKLLDADATKKAITAMHVAIRDGLAAIPRKCAPMVHSAKDVRECEEIIDRQISDVLNRLSLELTPPPLDDEPESEGEESPRAV